MGDSCTKAHSNEELQEWIQRMKAVAKKKKQAIKEGLVSYQDRLIAEYQTCSNEVLIVSRGRQGGSSSPLHLMWCEKHLAWEGSLWSAKALLPGLGLGREFMQLWQ